MNPTRMLSKKTRREFLKSDHDPKDVPFIKDAADIFRVYESLYKKHTSIAIAYAVGALGGLRTSEVRALDWASVNLISRTIAVREQVQRRKGKAAARLTADGRAKVKDGEIRIVPILDSLYPLLEKHRVITGGAGLVCPPMLGMRGGAATGPLRRFLGDHRMGEELRQTLTELGIEPMIWYRATRHTFASQWVLGGGTLEKLQEVMGHSSVVTTERYSHLLPGRFTAADRGRIQIEVPTTLGVVVQEETRPAN
jgi:integrase